MTCRAIKWLSRADKRFGPGLKKNPDGDECKRLVEQPRNVPPGAVRAAGCTTMASFAAVAPRQMGAPFIDSTGLVGLYETSYYYDAAGGFLGRGITPDMSSGEVAAAADGPPDATALQSVPGGLRHDSPRPAPRLDRSHQPTAFVAGTTALRSRLCQAGAISRRGGAGSSECGWQIHR